MFLNLSSPLLVRAIRSHAHTPLHIRRTQPQLSTQTMNSMKLENVVPLPLEFNEYKNPQTRCTTAAGCR